MMTNLIWLATGGFWTAYGVRWLYAALKAVGIGKTRPIVKDYAGRNLLGSAIFTAVYLSFFALGLGRVLLGAGRSDRDWETKLN